MAIGLRNFAITPEARHQLVELRAEWERRTGTPAAALWLGWAVSSGAPVGTREGLIVSFIDVRQAAGIASDILKVSGEDVVFFVTDASRHNFEHARLDYNAGQGLYLTAA